MMNLLQILPALFAAPKAGATCKLPANGFLSFPHWYEYLPGTVDPQGFCSPSLGSLADIWLIVAAVIEILLRVAALLAVGFIIYGSVEYIISQGEPEKTSRARATIVNALVGLALAVTAAAIISFVAGRIS